ncbi:putative acetyltransferase [Bacillus sp. TS-2]|nr:putative acetyltransferase [Bacillus sp. TS-2]
MKTMSLIVKFGKKINKLYNKLHNKKIIIFGTGEGSYQIIPILIQFDLEISYFLDNDGKNRVNKHLNKSVYDPEKLKQENSEDIFILVTSIHYQEIGKQLSGTYNLKEGIQYCSLLKEKSNEETRNVRFLKGIKIGKYSYGYERLCRFYSNQIKSIGSFCSINSTVDIAGPNHPTQYISTHPFFYNKLIHGKELVPSLLNLEEDVVNIVRENKKIIIGNDVWIGKGVLLLPSIKIGNGAIIGAGAVVTKDVPDYAIVAGSPAKVIRYRFSQQEIIELNNIAWWDWDDDKIRKNIQLFINNKEFLRQFNTN